MVHNIHCGGLVYIRITSFFKIRILVVVYSLMFFTSVTLFLFSLPKTAMLICIKLIPKIILCFFVHFISLTQNTEKLLKTLTQPGFNPCLFLDLQNPSSFLFPKYIPWCLISVFWLNHLLI